MERSQDGQHIDKRAGLLPEEERAGSDDPHAQAAAILEESEARSFDREDPPGQPVERRTSDEATPPTGDE
jgi:hypothetical protein